jgi:signal recognition particle GTPase
MIEEQAVEGKKNRATHPDQVDSRMDSVRIVRGSGREIVEIRELERVMDEIRAKMKKK